MNNTPDGININANAGSTHIEGLQKYVRENKVEVFLSNLGVTFADKAEEDFDDDEVDDLDENNNGASSSSISPDGKDRSRYSINGQGSFNKRKLPVECVINYLRKWRKIM